MPILGSPVSLEEFRNTVKERAAYFTDENILADQLKMDSASGELVHAQGNGEGGIKTSSYPMTQHGFSTFCQKILVPYKYMLRCPPDLRATNVNHWLGKRNGKEFFVRFDSHPDDVKRIRAVLSNRYADLPNLDFADMMIMSANEEYHFTTRYELTPTRLVGQLVSSSPKFTSKDNNLCGGIHYCNSEIGLSKLTLESMVYSRVEKSGIILREMAGFSEKHIGDKSDFRDNFKKSLDNIMANISGAINSLEDLKNIAVDDVPEIVEVILENNQAKEGEKVAVERARVTIEAKNLYDVVCIFIRAATDPDISLDDRESLQRIGGKVVMNAKRYQRWL